MHGFLFMLGNQIGITFSAESEFRRFLQSIGATSDDIDEGVRGQSDWIFTCKSEQDAEAIIVLFTE